MIVVPNPSRSEKAGGVEHPMHMHSTISCTLAPRPKFNVAMDQPPPRLLTPGPMALDRDVKMRMLTDLGSRGNEIIKITADVRRMLTDLANGLGTHETVLLQGSGTFAVEAALGTFCNPQSRVLAVVNGIYGERAVQILQCHKVFCEAIRCDADRQPDIDAIAHRLRETGDFTHLFFVHCETTTGIMNPLDALCELARSHGLLTIVDAMSAFGGTRIDLHRVPIDVLVASGNKCVEAPPGIAFAIVERSLLERSHSNSTSFCLDLHDQWLSFDRTGEWRSTPPTHVLQALHAALQGLCTEGVPARQRRYERLRDRVITGLQPLTFEPVVAPQYRAPVCVALRCPAWRGRASAAFQQFNSTLISAGLRIYSKMHAPTSSFRIGCIGAIQDNWVDELIAAARRHMQPK